jgi:hypothetical protein
MLGLCFEAPKAILRVEEKSKIQRAVQNERQDVSWMFRPWWGSSSCPTPRCPASHLPQVARSYGASSQAVDGDARDENVSL